MVIRLQYVFDSSRIHQWYKQKQEFDYRKVTNLIAALIYKVLFKRKLYNRLILYKRINTKVLIEKIAEESFSKIVLYSIKIYFLKFRVHITSFK